MSADPIGAPPVHLQSLQRTPRSRLSASHKPENDCANRLQQNLSTVVRESADETQSAGRYSTPAADRTIGAPENEIRRLQLSIGSARFARQPSPLTDRELLPAIASAL